MEDSDVELTAKDLAQAFGVRPDTVGSWVRERRLAGTVPRGARRLGRRFRLEDVRKFAAETPDEGYTARQFEAWWRNNRARIAKEDKGPVPGGTNVLTLSP